MSVRFPRKPKHPRYKGTYHVDSQRLREAAYADPSTRCWRCGKTLAQHPRHHTGRPATWQAGHVNETLILPEGSTCNTWAGAAEGERRARRATSTKRTNLSW